MSRNVGPRERRRNFPATGHPCVAAVVNPIAGNPERIRRRSRRHVLDWRLWWRRGLRPRHAKSWVVGVTVAPGRIRRSVNRTAFLIDTVANHSTGDRTGRRADESPTKGVTAAAVMANNATGQSAERATCERTLLGIRAGAHAAAEKRGQRDRRNKKH